MRFSRAEEQTTAEVLKIVNYDHSLIAEAVALIRYEKQRPDHMPVFMKEVLDYLTSLK